MNDAELELTLQRWLSADSAALGAPVGLRRRILDIPAEPVATTSWWHRFSSVPMMSASVAAAGVAGVLVATLFLGIFDRPPGADGGTCNNRQVQQAFDHLRDADGYRFAHRSFLRDFDPESSFQDPEYLWTEHYLAAGAYLAPDRATESVVSTTSADPPFPNRVHADGQTFELREIEGESTWVRATNWPTANLVYGYAAGAMTNFASFTIPGVLGLEYGETPVPEELLPGTGGCTVAALLPGPETHQPLPVETGGVPVLVEIPESMIEHRIVALRVDVSSQRPISILLTPAVDTREFQGQQSQSFELTWEAPDADEIVAPTDYIEDPNNRPAEEQTPPPTPSPPPVDPSAWAPIELPLPVGFTGTTSVNAAVAGEGILVAVGSQAPAGATPADEGWGGLIWMSPDAASWSLVDPPAEFERLTFSLVGWDGATFLAIGYRVGEPLDDGTFTPERPESWISSDGITWEPGGVLDEGANPNRLVAGGPGWVMTGSVSTVADNQQRPVVFTSADGARWTTVELAGTGSGALGPVVVEDDGSLLATGCESPGETNSHATGELCIMRLWRSADGVDWTSGAVLDVEIGDLERNDDGYVAISPGLRIDPMGASTVLRSADGSAWTSVEGFPVGEAALTGVTLLGETIVVDGQVIGSGMPFAAVWQSADGVAWERIGLGLPEEGLGSFVQSILATPSGMSIIGSIYVSEMGESIPVVWVEP